MDQSDYTTAWLVYLVAALVLAVLCWRFFRRFLPRELAWLLQCWLLALLFTPWYVQDGQDIMAPAFIVLALDVITIEPVAGIRALTPLVLALLAGLLVAAVLSVVYRIRRRNEPALPMPVGKTSADPAGEGSRPLPVSAMPADKPARKPRTSRKQQETRVEPVLSAEIDPTLVVAAGPEVPKKPRRKPRPKRAPDAG